MIFKNISELTEFFGVSPATFYNAQKAGHFVLDGKIVNTEDPRNWHYFLKRAKKKKFDLKEFFGPKFDESKIVAPVATPRKRNRNPKPRNSDEFEENTAKPGKTTDLDDVKSYAKKKAKFEALLKESQYNGQEIKNKKAMNGLLDKEVVLQTFQKMLLTVDNVVLGSASDLVGEELNRLMLDKKESSLRERVTEFQNWYAAKVKATVDKFKDEYESILTDLWDQADDE